MSLRATTDHIDDYGREHLFEIYDDQWVGGVTALKNTGRGFGQFSHQVLDPRKPWENPIQKGVLELSVWLSSTGLLDDIKDGDEQQFHIIHKIDSTQEWAGYIYNDLTTYEENILPFRVTLVAKDFTDLGGKDYKVSGSLPDNRETVITTIATLLNEVGFDIPIKTHTSWIENSINSGQDYLRQIYHETKALREFGRTGDESDEAITVEEALEKLCSNHKLILKQTGGAYWIDQLTAYENPASVQETVYDIDGTLDTAEANVDTTVSANTTGLKVVISSDNRDNSGIPGLKRARVKYDHRTAVSFLKFEDEVILDSGNTSESQSQLIISDGGQTLTLEADIEADIPNDEENGRVQWQIEIDTGTKTYYWDEDNTEWTETTTINETDLTFVGPGAQEDPANNELWIGSVGVDTTALPGDADGTLTVTLMRALGDAVFADQTRWVNTAFDVQGSIASENSTSIDYQLTQSGVFSVVEKFEDDWYGDGPTGYSPGALRKGTADSDFTSDTWGRRGQTADKNFHENQLKEPMDVQRGWRRLLSALLKGTYYPHNVLSYDSESFYYLGGRWDLFTGNFQADLFALDIVTGTDTFEDLPKFTDETGSGTGSTGGGTSGGLDQSTADARYFKQASLLSEASDLPTLRSNIGLGASDNVEFAEGTFNGDVDINSNFLTLNDTSDKVLRFQTGGVDKLTLQWDDSESDVFLRNETTNDTLYIRSTGKLEYTNFADFKGKTRIIAETQSTSGAQGIFETQATALAGAGNQWYSMFAKMFTKAGESGVNELDGLLTAIYHNEGFTLPTWKGVETGGAFVDGASSVITDSYGLEANMPTVTNGGSVTNAHAIHIKSMSMTGITNPYALYSELAAPSYIRNNLGIGDDDPQVALSVGGVALIGKGRSNSYIELNDDNGINYRLTNGISSNGVFAIQELSGNNYPLKINSGGTVEIETAQIQTLRTTLFKPNTIIGMGGKSIWNATSTVVSIDTGANTIVAEDAVFANGDKVVVSSAIYNQSGFSNVELNITSNGSAVTGGTQYSYTVNSGSATDIGTGDTIVKIDGDLIIVDAEDGPDKPSISGYSDLAGFGDSPASGGSADPSWLLTPTKFFYEGMGYNATSYEDATSAGSGNEATTGNAAVPRGSVTNQLWVYVEANGTTAATYTSRVRVYTRVYKHKFGTNKVRFTFVSAEDNDTDNLNISGIENQIWITFDNTDDTGEALITFKEDVTTSTRQKHVVEVDISSLTEGDFYDIEIYAHATFTIDSSNGNEQFVRTQLGYKPEIEFLGS